MPGATPALLEGEEPRAAPKLPMAVPVQGAHVENETPWEEGKAPAAAACALKPASNPWDQLGCSPGLVLREKQQNCLFESHEGFKNTLEGEFSPSFTGTNSLSEKEEDFGHNLSLSALNTKRIKNPNSIGHMGN